MKRVRSSASTTMNIDKMTFGELNLGNIKFNIPHSHHQSVVSFTQNKSPKYHSRLFDKLHNEKLSKISDQVKEESISQILKEEKELTFQPCISASSKFNTKRRSIEEFLEDMTLHEINREEKKFNAVLQEEIKLQNMQYSLFKKQHLDENSWKRITDMYEEGKYKQRQKSRSKLDHYTDNLNLTHQKHRYTPKISKRATNITRKQPISDYLYSDAKRRRYAPKFKHESLPSNNSDV